MNMNNGCPWNDERMSKAQKLVTERFAENSVAGYLTTTLQVDDTETTVKSNRFDFQNGIVIDREVFGLYEPFSFCQFSQAQVDEFKTMQGDGLMVSKAVTTLTRAASRLARWHDYLFFLGLQASRPLIPAGVQMPNPNNPPQSLREAALVAEQDQGIGPIPIGNPSNERLVDAVYAAVLRLEGLGYYSSYHLVLGEALWQALHQPTSGSMVLPRDRIEPTLMGGSFYRTTTLPPNEALLVSLDGPTFDCVIAGEPAAYPQFQYLRIETGLNGEQFYLFRVRERFAPRIRENRAIARLVLQQQQQRQVRQPQRGRRAP